MTGDEGAINSTKLFNGSEAVIYKPKKSTFTTVTTSSADALSEQLGDALGGGGSWSKVGGSLIFGEAAG